MGISSEYRLEYMPLMIQKKKQVEYRIAMIGWARLSLSFLLYFGCFVLVFYSAHDLGRVYVHNDCVEKFIFYPDRFHFPLFLLLLIPVQIINLPIC